MRFSQIVQTLEAAGMEPDIVGLPGEDPDILDVCQHTDQAGPGTLYCCVNGFERDGHVFASEMAGRHASAFIAERPLDTLLPTVLTEDVRKAAGLAASAVWGFPARYLRLAGITGTNGKSTTAWIVRSIFRASGVSCGMLGTILYDDGLVEEPGCRTTPDAPSVQRWLARMVKNGCGACVMEASSHGIDLKRLEGCVFDALAFTNLTPEHLDFHSDMENYFRAKLRLFTDYAGPEARFALNLDDPYGFRIAEIFPESAATYAIDRDADISAQVVSMDLEGTFLKIFLPGNRRSLMIRSPLTGLHNVSNVLAAVALTTGLGIGADAVVEGIEKLQAVPGRLQRFLFGNGVICFIDYAHTPDGLEKVLRSVGRKSNSSVHVVFGHGGERTTGNRPLLGRVAAEHSDHVVLTMDNPRSEDALDIARQIESGMDGSRIRSHSIILDRREAIHAALDAALPGDVVVVAGKGPETTMILAHGAVPYSDEQSVREWSGARRIPIVPGVEKSSIAKLTCS